MIAALYPSYQSIRNIVNNFWLFCLLGNRLDYEGAVDPNMGILATSSRWRSSWSACWWAKILKVRILVHPL